MAAHTFETLKRERQFSNPSEKGHVNATLDQLATPHIESFNALFDDSGLDSGDTDGKGLLSLALQDIGQKVVFNGVGTSESPLGARLSCKQNFKFDVRYLKAHFEDSLDRKGGYWTTNGVRKGSPFY
jgi:hypothetical protein